MDRKSCAVVLLLEPVAETEPAMRVGESWGWLKKDGTQPKEVEGVVCVSLVMVGPLPANPPPLPGSLLN